MRVSAQLAVCGRADGSASVALSTTLFEGQQLLSTEGLIVDLGSRLDQILEVGSKQEVSQVNKFTVGLILHVDDTPSVLTSTNLLAIDNDVLLRTNNGEGYEALYN